MTHEVQVQLVALLAVGPLIIAGLVSDLKNRTLPNRLNACIAVLSLTIYTVAGGLEGFAGSAWGLLIGFGLLLPLYLFRMIGAGDIKYLAALGAFLGYTRVDDPSKRTRLRWNIDVPSSDR